MSNEERERALEAENASLREQKQQLERQLAGESLKKRRARSRDCFISAIFVFTIAYFTHVFTIPFAGKPQGTEQAAMVLGSLGAALVVAGIFIALSNLATDK